MRKIKKFNRQLIVKFNDREKRLNKEDQGEYGIIETRHYTGCFNIDVKNIVYGELHTLDEAIKLVELIEKQIIIDQCYKGLICQVKKYYGSNVNRQILDYALFGCKVVLYDMEILTEDEFLASPNWDLLLEKEIGESQSLEVPIRQTFQKNKVTSNELNRAEQALGNLFRMVYAPNVDEDERNLLASGLSTFGRLIEKEKHIPDIVTTVAIIRLSVGLYDGSLNINLTSETENRIEADIFDTIHRIKTGHISIGRMGRTCYIREIDFKFL